MKRVLILGATGMLGSALYHVLKDNYELVLTVRNLEKIKLLEDAFGDINDRHSIVHFDAEEMYKEHMEKRGNPSEYLENFFNEVGDIDYVINAIGVTIPFSLENPALTHFINGALPHIFASILGEKFIHITTDCVYNGKENFPYHEESTKTPVDIYGLSKSLGEPEVCLTLRTSIIGKELEGFTGFLDWFLSQEGKEINGFTEHYWNGLTTKQFAKICHQIMSEPEKYPKKGLYHVFSTTVSKYDMLLAFQKKFEINCVINKDSDNRLNRTLASVKSFQSDLNVPSFQEMIDDL